LPRHGLTCHSSVYLTIISLQSRNRVCRRAANVNSIPMNTMAIKPISGFALRNHGVRPRTPDGSMCWILVLDCRTRPRHRPNPLLALTVGSFAIVLVALESPLLRCRACTSFEEIREPAHFLFLLSRKRCPFGRLTFELTCRKPGPKGRGLRSA